MFQGSGQKRQTHAEWRGKVDSIDRLEGAIVNGSEGYFDEPGMREDLHDTERFGSGCKSKEDR
jgi:hypothetical protein